MRLAIAALLLGFVTAHALTGCTGRSSGLPSALGLQGDDGFRDMVAAAIEDGRRRYEESRPRPVR